MEEHISLQPYTTFGVPCTARYFIRIRSTPQLASLIQTPIFRSHPHLVLGSGSNILLACPTFPGIVLKNELSGIDPVGGSAAHATLRIGSGTPWSTLVDYCLAHDLGGIENLALIPGTVGAAPVQNVGAYGVEIASLVLSVDTVDLVSGETRVLANAECCFAYRDSVFKRQPQDMFITAVTLRLTNPGYHRLCTGYPAVAMGLKEKQKMGIRDVAEVVCRLRRCKLPDPRVVGNAGSFFKNPVVQRGFAKQFPEVKMLCRADGLLVVPAAALIEECGWKGWRDEGVGVGVAETHALVLVNHGEASGEDIRMLAGRIGDSVWRRFGVRLEMEVRVVTGLA